MQDENNIFSDLPGLGDEEALNQYLNNQVVNEIIPNTQTPSLAQPNQNVQEQNTQPNSTPNPTESTTTPNNTPKTYTYDEVQAMLSQERQMQQKLQQNAIPNIGNVRPSNNAYSPQELNAINNLLSRGYSLEQIMSAVQSNRMKHGATASTDPRIINKINNIEKYLQQQQYQEEQNAFIDKMTEFGNKFGLSEDDLVTFGNVAMSKGINLINTPDVEIIFKALYPEQYAIRMQRISNPQTSQIYGGTSVPENQNANTSKLEDAYVESFMKRSMPNQYGMQKR